MFQVRIRRDVLVLAATEERREGAEKAGRVAEGPVEIEVELEQVLPQEDDDLGPGQDPDIRRQPEFEGVLADDPVAERVERPDRGIRVAVRDELIDADLHLRGRLLRERQCQDFRRLRPTGRDQPRDSARDHLGLARAGSGNHEQRAEAVGDGLELLGVQAAEQRVESGRRVAVDDGRGIGDESVPDG